MPHSPTKLAQHWQANRVIYITLMGMMATGFPFTILTVALKPIAEEFSVTEALATWTVSAPMLISAVCFPLMGKVGDTYGHRRVFLIGISLSTVFAGCCFFAWDIWSLIVFRVLSMLFAGATTPSGMAILFHQYDGDERGRAVGWWAMGGPGSAALGLIAGGPMVDIWGWRSVFMFQILCGAVAWIIALTSLPETHKRPAAFDHIGNLILIIALLCLLFAISSVSDQDIAALTKWGVALFGVIGLLVFLKYEGYAADPIVPAGLLTTRNFANPSMASFMLQAAYLGALVVTPITLIDIFGYSISVAAGLMLLRTASLTIATPFGGRLATALSERIAATIGISLQAIGIAIMAAGVYWLRIELLLVGLVIQGVGHGLAFPPLTAIIATAVEPGLFGTASGLNRLISQIGSSLGLSLFGALLAIPPESLNLPMIFLIGSGLTLIGLIPAGLIKRPNG
ncbi:MAG: MFS transporter [Alphaproteobacteria bacterium]